MPPAQQPCERYYANSAQDSPKRTPLEVWLACCVNEVQTSKRRPLQPQPATQGLAGLATDGGVSSIHHTEELKNVATHGFNVSST